jgi:uncharacterized protein YggU (UPF0235/DUF167 family)
MVVLSGEFRCLRANQSGSRQKVKVEVPNNPFAGHPNAQVVAVFADRAGVCFGTVVCI